MKKRYYAIAVIVLIIGSLVAGILLGSGRVLVPYLSNRETSTSDSTSTTCVLSSATKGIVIQLVMDNYSTVPPQLSPVVGAKITGNDLYFCGSQYSQLGLIPASTNSTGWTTMLDGGSGNYYLTITHGSELNYTLTVPTVLLGTTYVVYNLSNGNVSTYTCYYGEPC